MKKWLVFLLLFSACKKAEDRTCWKFTGKETERIVALDKINDVTINTYLVVNLVQDTVNFLAINGGENVINAVEISLQDGNLILTNNNKCKFLRDPKHKIIVEIHFTSIGTLYYRGSEEVKSIGKIKQPIFNLEIKESSGTVELDLDVDQCQLDIEPCFANYIIHGTSKTARFSIKGNGYGDARDFKVSEKIICVSRSSSDLYINGNTNYLKGETNDLGNIYYTGMPGQIEYGYFGEGKLISEP